MTDAPPAQVAAVLSPLRVVADELVVALDAGRVTTERSGAYDDLADVVLLAPYEPPLERSLAWLHAECSGDWILRVDGDEVASAALVGMLPVVMGDRACTHAWIPRRWLFGDVNQMLDQRPWWPDFQLRLVRNDPELLRFPGSVHTSVEVPGNAVFLPGPLYHADLLLVSEADRELKVRRYERQRPGVRIAGWPMNRAYYLPERRADPLTAAVPPEDGAAVRRLVDGAGAPPARDKPGRGRKVRRQDIDEHRERSRAAPVRAEGEVRLLSSDRELVANEFVTLMAEVRNTGACSWLTSGRGVSPTLLSYQWLAQDGSVAVEGIRTPLPADVDPGTERVVALPLSAPDHAGIMGLRVGLLLEHEYWFGLTEPISFTIAPRRRVGLIAGYSPFRHVGDDVIVRAHLEDLADQLPGLEPLLFGDDPVALTERFGTQAAKTVATVLYADHKQTQGRRTRLSTIGRGMRLVLKARTPAGRASLPADHRAFLEELASCEALVAASAGGLTGRYWREVLWPHMFTILTARAMGVPSLVSGVTIGPFQRRLDALVAAAGLHAARLVVTRDRTESLRELRALGLVGRRVVAAPDPAVALPPAPAAEVERELAGLGLAPGTDFVAVSLQPASSVGAAVDAVAAVLELEETMNLPVLFVPMVDGAGTADDGACLPALRKRLVADRVRVPDPLPADDVLLGMVQRARIAIGTRYHLVVFAAAGGVPAIGLKADDYSARRFEGLRSWWADIDALDLPADPARLALTARRLLQGERRPLTHRGPLPGISALRDLLA